MLTEDPKVIIELYIKNKLIGTVKIMKKIIISSIVATTLFSIGAPTIQAAAAEKNESSQITQISPEIDDLSSVATAFNLYLTRDDKSFNLDSRAAELVNSDDYQIMLNAVNELNVALKAQIEKDNSQFTTFAAPSMTIYTKYLSNQQAKDWSYNLSRAGTGTGLIGLLVALSVPAVALVGVAGLAAGGIADQIDYKNNGNGVILYFRLNGISVQSR